jgi:hypothetical protein
MISQTTVRVPVLAGGLNKKLKYKKDKNLKKK